MLTLTRKVCAAVELLASLLDFAESKNVLLDCAKDITVECD